MSCDCPNGGNGAVWRGQKEVTNEAIHLIFPDYVFGWELVGLTIEQFSSECGKKP